MDDVQSLALEIVLFSKASYSKAHMFSLMRFQSSPPISFDRTGCICIALSPTLWYPIRLSLWLYGETYNQNSLPRELMALPFASSSPPIGYKNAFGDCTVQSYGSYGHYAVTLLSCSLHAVGLKVRNGDSPACSVPLHGEAT